MKKKNNLFLLALTTFLLGGAVFFSQPTSVDASVACGSQIFCTSSIGNRMNGQQAQVRGTVSGILSGRNMSAGAGIRLGSRSTGTTTGTGNGIVSVSSAWLDDRNDTSDIAVFGHVR